MRVFAPSAFRWPASTGQDYPYGLQDIASDTLARTLLTAGLVVADDPGDQVNAGDKPLSQFSATQAVALQSLVSGAGSAVVSDQSAALSSVQAVFYKMNEGAGSSLAEDGGDGPAIAVAGSVAGAWANANWFTHDAAGNTQQIKANAYVDNLISMQSEGSIILGIDYFVTTWPSTTETMWGLHRTDTATGGVRMPLVSGSPGRFSVYYKPNGGSEVEVVGYAPGTYLSVRNSILVELRVLPALGELRVYLYHNGRLERSNVWPLGTAPATDASGGLNFSGYGGTPAQKIGSGSSVGSRTANAFVMRHSGADRNIAGRLAAYVAANQALPTWLTRM